PLALLDRADDRVAGDRAAAARELHRHALGAADGDAAPAARIVLVVRLAQQPPRHDRGQALAEADVGEQLLARARAALAHHALPARLVHRGERPLERLQRLLEQALAEAGGFLVLHGLQEVADVRAR